MGSVYGDEWPEVLCLVYSADDLYYDGAGATASGGEYRRDIVGL